MRNLKSIIATVVLGLVSLTATAQNPEADAEAQALGYKPQPYTFIQVQGGVNKVFSPGSKFNPTFSIGVGRMFSNIIGARLHFNGYETKNGLKSIGANYKFKYITGDIDVMVNIFNIFKAKNNRPFELFFIGGIGANYAWKNNEFADIVRANRNAVSAGTATAIQEDISNAWGPNTTRKQLLSHNLRVGLLADFNISRHWSVGVEADLNNVSDRFNSKFNNSNDWLFTAQLSITYKFGQKKPDKIVAAPVVTPVDYGTSDSDMDKENANQAIAIVVEPTNETLFYQIRETDLDANKKEVIKKVAEWCKKNPDKVVTIDGYADRGTGNPQINKEYAQQRAEKVAKALQQEGIPASQLKVDSHGDTIQPFPENDKNRCVIIVGK
ncbi:MAG: OmpA family protein [Bacteroidaceae bacterium]|nr:OmpA family protein [Bacteroidaceae bacterium]MBQ4380778.1 OmpA family protein [Bacteroidaceae bacterium]